MQSIDPRAQAVLDFWFEEVDPEKQFKKDVEFDNLIEERFGTDVLLALDGGFSDWEETAAGRLALIILLDQFTRNIFRGHPKAFAGDARALRLSQSCVSEGDLDTVADFTRRAFILMPMMHSEDINIHDAALPIFEKYANEKTLDYANRHRDIIAKWGRYPHRNAALERESTPEELSFLEQPGSSF
ncbi:MAG: DUF924 family protein [Pseudomonadota bacterium]